MKKALLITIISFALIGYSNAQELGVRFGYAHATNVAVDGIFSTGEFSRIHADVSFGGNGVGIDALWDFLYRPLSGEAFNWYMGAGPYMDINDPFLLGAAFEAGLEYRFNSVPIALGFDWRPKLSIIENTDFYADGFGLNIRYVFGQ
jgi:hypothetical protein